MSQTIESTTELANRSGKRVWEVRDTPRSVPSHPPISNALDPYALVERILGYPIASYAKGNLSRLAAAAAERARLLGTGEEDPIDPDAMQALREEQRRHIAGVDGEG